MKAIATQLESIVTSAGVCEWENIEVRRAEQIEQAIASKNLPNCIVYPRTQTELAEVIACAALNNWRVLPCGSGSKIDWGGLVKNIDVVVSTERLNQLIEHAIGDLTITVEAGVKVAQIQATLATAGQFLALDPIALDSATIGGVVATADTNSLRQRYGSVRDQLLGITFVRADGEIAKAGGRVVKNVAGYDLMKLFTGSYGTLGLITQVTFRVYPLPQASETVVLTGEADAIAQATSILRSSALTPTKADLISTELGSSLGVGKKLGLIACFQSLSDAVKEQSTRLLAVGQQLGLQGAIYCADDEAQLWHKLQTQIWNAKINEAVTCKIGVLPSAAVATLNQLEQIAPDQGMSLIHAGSGLGLLQLSTCDLKTQTLLQIRTHCQKYGGFLTILKAPIPFKQQLDVWGYRGNALDLMRRIKQQFDPKELLSPHRFVGGI